MLDPHLVYSPPQIWRESGTPRAMVYDALEAGELRAVRRGRRWLISGFAAIAWIERLGEEHWADEVLG